jgi:hypothetical protein
MPWGFQFGVRDRGRRLVAAAVCNTDLYDPAALPGMLAYYINLLEKLAADPSARIAELAPKMSW